MKFIVNKEENKKEIKNGYLLVINTMIGDADGYDTVEVGYFKEEELHLLEEVIDLCERMKNAFPHGMGGGDDYHDVEGFLRWFDDGAEDYDIDNADIAHLAPFEWSYSPDNWGDQNSLTDYYVLYYKDDIEYDVSIEM